MPFPVDVKYIKEAETELGIEFPAKFRAKMTFENGGELLVDDEGWWLYPFFDKSDNKRISRTNNHIILETRQARKWINFPDYAIAIAGNETGDHLILLPDENQPQILREEIHFWFHEKGKMQEVAKSINDLM